MSCRQSITALRVNRPSRRRTQRRRGTGREQRRSGRAGRGSGVGSRVLRVKPVLFPPSARLIFPPGGKPTGEGRFRAKGLWDARGRQQGRWCPIRPAGPSDHPARRGRGLRPGSALGRRRWLTYLVVAALSAAAGVGATLTVQHLTAPGPGAAGMPRDAAADRHGRRDERRGRLQGGRARRRGRGRQPAVPPGNGEGHGLRHRRRGRADTDQQPRHRRRDQRHGHAGDVGPELSGADPRLRPRRRRRPAPGARGAAAQGGQDRQLRAGAGGHARAGHRQRGRAGRLADGRARGDQQPGPHHHGQRPELWPDRDAVRHAADQRRHPAGRLRRAAGRRRRPGDRDRHGGRREHRLFRLRHPHRPGHADRQADRGRPPGHPDPDRPARVPRRAPPGQQQHRSRGGRPARNCTRPAP